MAEETPSAPSKQLLLQKIYVKDLSFESPRAPDVFSRNAAPQTQLNIRSSAREVGKDTQEIALTLTIEAKDQDQTLFLVELVQAGVFLIKGYTDEERHMLTGSYCPGSLYPFAREAIADIVTRGGFPQLLLQPINFDALYAQALRDRSQNRADGDPEAAPPATPKEEAH
ncbi:MAG TPA: protein-export chaperone SecB [Gammaproteobacteria bacterium]|nr:protein-export chaperone SecB [Gammaproteobacteria bacterium]